MERFHTHWWPGENKNKVCSIYFCRCWNLCGVLMWRVINGRDACRDQQHNLSERALDPGPGVLQGDSSWNKNKCTQKETLRNVLRHATKMVRRKRVVVKMISFSSRAIWLTRGGHLTSLATSVDEYRMDRNQFHHLLTGILYRTLFRNTLYLLCLQLNLNKTCVVQRQRRGCIDRWLYCYSTCNLAQPYETLHHLLKHGCPSVAHTRDR